MRRHPSATPVSTNWTADDDRQARAAWRAAFQERHILDTDEPLAVSGAQLLADEPTPTPEALWGLVTEPEPDYTVRHPWLTVALLLAGPWLLMVAAVVGLVRWVA